MTIISLVDNKENKQKENLLEVLDELRSRIENGEIEEFVAVSADCDGDTMLHACVKDHVGGIGMLEVGKMVFYEQV